MQPQIGYVRARNGGFDALERFEYRGRHCPGTSILQPAQVKAELPTVMREQQQTALLEEHLFAVLLRGLPLRVVQEPFGHSAECALPDVDGLPHRHDRQAVTAEYPCPVGDACIGRAAGQPVPGFRAGEQQSRAVFIPVSGIKRHLAAFGLSCRRPEGARIQAVAVAADDQTGHRRFDRDVEADHRPSRVDGSTDFSKDRRFVRQRPAGQIFALIAKSRERARGNFRDDTNFVAAGAEAPRKT